MKSLLRQRGRAANGWSIPFYYDTGGLSIGEQAGVDLEVGNHIQGIPAKTISGLFKVANEFVVGNDKTSIR